MEMKDDALTPQVIVVDDDASLRQALVFLLESVGWQVVAYDSAESLLAALDELTHPGCLILDVRMPVMSGLELQRILNERNIHFAGHLPDRTCRCHHCRASHEIRRNAIHRKTVQGSNLARCCQPRRAARSAESQEKRFENDIV